MTASHRFRLVMAATSLCEEDGPGSMWAGIFQGRRPLPTDPRGLEILSRDARRKSGIKTTSAAQIVLAVRDTRRAASLN